MLWMWMCVDGDTDADRKGGGGPAGDGMGLGWDCDTVVPISVRLEWRKGGVGWRWMGQDGMWQDGMGRGRMWDRTVMGRRRVGGRMVSKATRVRTYGIGTANIYLALPSPPPPSSFLPFATTHHPQSTDPHHSPGRTPVQIIIHHSCHHPSATSHQPPATSHQPPATTHHPPLARHCWLTLA